jgi:hypothetical protein
MLLIYPLPWLCLAAVGYKLSAGIASVIKTETGWGWTKAGARAKVTCLSDGADLKNADLSKAAITLTCHLVI